MAANRFPYSFISCPCSDSERKRIFPQRTSREVDPQDEDLQEEDKTFDPRDPRASFSLFPPEHLLYCEECHDIKCARCITEEIICWYCPSCLFETPSSAVRGEGNRCARNCFNCPICTSQLITTSLGDAKEGPWILNCNYCMWTTLDIGIKFDQPTKIRAQLDRISNGGRPKLTSKSTETAEMARKSSLSREPLSPLSIKDNESTEKADPPLPSDPSSRFTALRAFYKDQITSTTDPTIPSSAADFAYSSPSSIARILNIYATHGSSSTLKKYSQKPAIMREALTESEGLILPSALPITQPQHLDTPTLTQKLMQRPPAIGNPTARTVADLRPMPALLRTKRSKRCKECKHILVRPEFKPTSTRYRIKLIALNYVPLVSLKPLGRKPSSIDGGDVQLEPGKPSQWILTLRNHLFDLVQVSLGTPSITPGRWGHRVTILCPQFEVGANSDVWDDALAQKGVSSPGRDQVAGKIYDRGRNWTSVILEIVPATILNGRGEEPAQQDEDVIELPMRVRLEWRQSDIDGSVGEKKKSEKALEEGVEEGKRELAYWMVLGVGRVTS